MGHFLNSKEVLASGSSYLKVLPFHIIGSAKRQLTALLLIHFDVARHAKANIEIVVQASFLLRYRKRWTGEPPFLG